MKTYENEMSQAERIFGFAGVLKEGRIPGDSYDLERFPYLRHVEPLLAKLNDSRASRFIPTLQSRLDGYASTLLSSRWSEVQDQDVGCGHGLFRRVYRECCFRRGFRNRADKPLRMILALLLLDAAYHRAKEIQRDLVADFSDLRLAGLTYCVMPSPARGLKEAGIKGAEIPIVTTLLVATCQTGGVSGCHVAKRDQYSKLSVERLGSESMMPLDQRRLYGLLTISNETMPVAPVRSD